MAKWTPGPWRYTGEWGEIKGPNDYHTVCTVNYAGTTIGTHGTYEANARLIASAPEMLEALKECQSVLAMIVHPKNAWSVAVTAETKARAVIAKAEGQP